IFWRITFTSPSLHGLWAAVEAGLGVTLRTDVGLPPALRVLDGLPPIAGPALPVCLHDGGRALAPTSASLKSIIAQTLAEKLPMSCRDKDTLSISGSGTPHVGPQWQRL